MKKITFTSALSTFVLIVLFSIQNVFATEIIDPIISASETEDIFACTGTTVTLPYSESFESGLGNWTQNIGDDDGDWTQDSLGTPSNFTGPSQASNGTFYYYTEATGNPNENNILTSPCIDLTSETSAYFSFDYHMYGAVMGTLDVEVSDDAGGSWTNIFTRTGQQQNSNIRPWRKEVIDLSAYAGNTINVRFSGTISTDYRSDMAIDNIVITSEPQYCGSSAIYNNSCIRRVALNTIDNNTPIESVSYSDFTSISTDLTVGNNYNLTTQINTNGNFFFGVYAWIDWNHDYVFDDATERYDMGTATNVTNGATSNSAVNFTVPVSAAIGQTRMRISSRYNSYPTSSCDEDNNFFGEVEDYTINVIAPAAGPEINITGLGNTILDGDITPNTTDDTDFGTITTGGSDIHTFTIENVGTSTLSLTGASPYAIISGSTYFSVTSIPSNSITSGNSTTFQITFDASVVGTHTATVTIASDDSDENPYTFTVTGITEDPTYCDSIGDTAFANGISNVSFSMINNASSAAPAYTDFTAVSTDIMIGETQPLSVNLNTLGGNNHVIYAWIDWNQDLDFTDPGEEYDLGTGVNLTDQPTTNSPLNITVPSGATLGNTRMRISARFGTVAPTSCETGFFGEVEDYTINVTANVPSPEINITGLGNTINNGDTTPVTTDDTDFGSVTTGATNANTFTIENTGTADLTLTGTSPYVTVSGANAALFTVTTIPASTITAGNSTTFIITYAPLIGGTHNATISIANDDSDENPYTFDITGTGIGPEPEIALTGLGNLIVDGDTTPATTDGTDFGVSAIGGNTVSDFIISNSGSATLTLTGASPYVVISGSTYFSVTTIPSNSIVSGGGSTTFQINYNPLAAGTHNATVSIANNDNDENPYTFDITGIATSTPTPEIDISGNGVSIADGDTTPDVADDTDFLTTVVGASRVKGYTITNSGTATLTLTGASPYVTITGADAAQFTVTSIPSNSIAVSGTTVFQISYTPSAAGTHNATITVANDDSDEGTYTFDITATAIVDTAPKYTIYYENFDANNGSWTASNPGGNSVWTYGTNTTEQGTEGNYWYTSNYNDYASNSDTYVTSPTLDMTGFDNLFFLVDIRYNTDADTDDGMNVEYSTDNGSTWTVLGAYSATPVGQWYDVDDVDALGAGSDGWAGLNGGGAGGGRSDFRRASIDLPATLHNNSQVRLRFHFASDGATVDDGVNFDNVFIKGDPLVPFSDPTEGPADITTNLKIWLKANANTSTTTDGSPLDGWSDNAFDNDAVGLSTQRPTFYDNSTENINHNPVIDFNTVDDTELKAKGGFYTEEYWVVVQPDGNVNSSSPLQGIVAGRKASQELAEDGTGLWINPGSLRFQFDDNIVSHMIGTTPGSLTGISDGSYGRAYASSTDSYDNEVIIFNIKTNSAGNQTEIYKNGIQIDNLSGETSASPFDQLPYAEADNSTFALGVGRITIFGLPFDSHLDGKITEFISYSSPNSTLDQLKIQSYLAIKNGVTLHDINSSTVTREGDENYIDSNGDVIWDVTVHNGFNYDIAGIGTDVDSNLNQKQSTSVNPGAVVTMGLTDIYATNNDNISSNTDVIADKNFLMWGNDNSSFNAATPITVDMSAGISGLTSLVDFTSIQRTWKVVERGTVGRVKVSVPEVSLSATLSPPGDYLMFISDTPTFSPTSEYRIMSLNGANLEAEYDFIGTKYITFGYAPEYVYQRSITFDGAQDFMDADNELDLTGAFTVSAWVMHDSNDYTVVSKRDASFTEGYEVRINSSRQVEMTWENGSTQTIQSSTQIPNGEWHQIAISYDGTTASLYIDGFLDTTETLTPPVATDRHFLIAAADERAPTDFYEGTIDEVRVWNIALSQDQIRFIMNQEIEENTDLTVTGRIIPSTISKNEFATTDWTEVAAYFPMNIYTFTNVKDESDNNLVAAIRNLDTVDFQTAPLPYVSTATGDWTNSATWTNGSLIEVPNAASIVDNMETIDWNIVQTSHDIDTQANATVLSLDVQSNELTIDNDSKMEVSHYLKLDGIMDLVGESQLIQTENSDLDITSNGNLERDQQGTADTYSYNIWCSPVSLVNGSAINVDHTVSALMNDGTDPNNPSIMNYSGGLNGAPSTPITISAFWIYKFANNTSGDYSEWQYVGPSGNMEVGEGYTMKGPGTGAVTTPQNYVFIGKPNNSTDAISIQKTIFGGNDYMVGNPFPSAMDANDFINDNPHLTGTLSFWEHWGGGSHVLAEYQAGYGLYTLSGGTPAVSHPAVDQTGSGTKTPGRYIAVGQGFFVTATTTGTIDISNSQRNFVKETSSSSIFMFGEGQDQQSTSANLDGEDVPQPDDTIYDAPDMRPKIRIGFDSPSQFHRQLLMTVDENTTFGIDRKYDGVIDYWPNEDMAWDIEDQRVIIQGVPNITEVEEFPLIVNNAISGPISIGIDAIEYIDTDVTRIFLQDRVQNTVTELTEGNYETTLEAGEHRNRYYIVFRTDTDEEETSEEEEEETSEEEEGEWEEEENEETSEEWEEEQENQSSGSIESGQEQNDDEQENDEEESSENENQEEEQDDSEDTTDNEQEEESSEDSDSDASSEDDTTTAIEDSLSFTEEDEMDMGELHTMYSEQQNMIIITKNQLNNVSQATLFSIVGQVIQQWKPEQGTTSLQLPVSNVSSGAYIITLETDMGLVTQKLIIH